MPQYNNFGPVCEGSEYNAIERSEDRHFRRPQSHLTPFLQRTPANVHISLMLPKLQSMGYIFAADMWSIFT